MNLKTIQEKAEYYSFLHKQNLNGRESEDELFELGIQVGIEETEQLQDEFAIEFAEWICEKAEVPYIKGTMDKTLEVFKKEKGL
jgi:hypothetical protein